MTSGALEKEILRPLQILILAITSMSRIGTPSGQATVASRTTFEALTVDSGEDSEEEQVAAQQTPPPERSVC